MAACGDGRDDEQCVEAVPIRSPVSLEGPEATDLEQHLEREDGGEGEGKVVAGRVDAAVRPVAERGPAVVVVVVVVVVVAVAAAAVVVQEAFFGELLTQVR